MPLLNNIIISRKKKQQNIWDLNTKIKLKKNIFQKSKESKIMYWAFTIINLPQTVSTQTDYKIGLDICYTDVGCHCFTENSNYVYNYK